MNGIGELAEREAECFQIFSSGLMRRSHGGRFSPAMCAVTGRIFPTWN